MTLMVILILGLGGLTFFAYTALRQQGQLRSMDDFRARWAKVDLEAFANLVDPSEDRFLQARLPAAVYRTIRRERLKAAWEYLGRVGQNAQLMVQAGQIIERHNSGAEAERARRHVDAAIQLRTAVFVARCSLAKQILLPTGDAGLEKVLRLYGNAAHSFDNVLDPGVATVSM